MKKVETFTLFASFCLLIIASGCKSLKKLSASQAFQSKEYALAEQLYTKKYNAAEKEEDLASFAYYAGKSCLYQGKFNAAAAWFQLSSDAVQDPKTTLELAFSLKRAEKYDAAAIAFQNLSQKFPNQPLYRREIAICKSNQDWIKRIDSTAQFVIEGLDDVNTNYSEFCPVFDRASKLYFSSDRKQTNKSELYAWSLHPFMDIYRLKNNGDVEKIPGDINSGDHEAVFCFNADESIALYTSCSSHDADNTYCKIAQAKVSSFRWEYDHTFDLGGGRSNDKHPALHHSDSVLVFSSDRSGGIGKTDLYISYLNGDQWSKPELLPARINTEGQELFPVWQGDTLYFSSDGLPGFGSLDIFKTYRLSSGEWASPQNLKYPFNSGADDFGLTPDTTLAWGDSLVYKYLFTSNRFQTKGDDILSISLLSDKSQDSLTSKPIFSIRLQLNFYSAGMYRGGISKAPLDSILITEGSSITVNTGTKNSITLDLPANSTFDFKFGRRQHLNQNLSLNTVAVPRDLTHDSTLIIVQEISLTPFEENKEFVLENVFYDFDKANLREESHHALDQLVRLLNSNPKVNIRLGAHTDCRGDETYNKKLAVARADSVIDYLVKQGISITRMTPVPYGEDDPAINCACADCTEEQHQLNRRTTFTIEIDRSR